MGLNICDNIRERIILEETYQFIDFSLVEEVDPYADIKKCTPEDDKMIRQRSKELVNVYCML